MTAKTAFSLNGNYYDGGTLQMFGSGMEMYGSMIGSPISLISENAIINFTLFLKIM